MGTVRKIIYRPGERPPSLPSYILVEFDKYVGPFIYFGDNRGLFSLEPTMAAWTDRSAQCIRRQVPINVAYALTIHKAQGITLDKAMVDIGNRESHAGISYVAYSRVRRLQDLLIPVFINYDRLSNIRTMPQIFDRQRFLADMEQQAQQQNLVIFNQPAHN